MRFALAFQLFTFDTGIDFDFGPGVFAGGDADGVAGGVFDAGGGDGDGGDLVGEGVGPEGWGWGGWFFFFFLFQRGRRGGGVCCRSCSRRSLLAEEIQQVLSPITRRNRQQTRALPRSGPRGEWIRRKGQGRPFIFRASEPHFSLPSCVGVGFFRDG